MTEKHTSIQFWESTTKQGININLLKDLWEYRFLIRGLAWNNLIASHRQTLLGWIWILIKPFLMVLIYVVLFVKILGVSTNAVPPLLFFLAGNTLWQLFSDVFASSSSTIVSNAATWNKIYYPRLVSPLSSLLYNLLMFSGQFLIFIVAWLLYAIKGDVTVYLLRLPWALLALMFQLMMALGTGLIISVTSVRYRDLNMLSSIALRAVFFITPVLYSWDKIPAKWQWLAWANPLAGVFELFRYAVLNGTFPPIAMLGLSILSSFVILWIGIQLFLKKATGLLELA